MMHVAISAHFWGRTTTGSGQYLHRLIEMFQQQHPCLQITLIMDAASARRAAVPTGVNWQVARSPFDGRSASLAKLWFEQIALPRAAEAVRADLLHVPYFAPPLRASMPVIVTIHDLIPMILPAYRGSALVRGYTALAARAARCADMILADSEASRRDILRLLEVEAERVRTVYLAVDPRYGPQAEEMINAVRRKFELPDRFVLYLGGFDVRKNVPHLIEAVARSKDRWPLVLAGRLPNQDSPFFPDPRRLVAEWGIEKRVRLTGWVDEDEKAPLLSAADLFVFPSAYEGFGLPILEAMACGTPTVTSAGSSLVELAGDGACLVPPGDVVALQQALEQLMQDERKRTDLATRGMKRAVRFTWEQCARETVAAYEQVI